MKWWMWNEQRLCVYGEFERKYTPAKVCGHKSMFIFILQQYWNLHRYNVVEIQIFRDNSPGSEAASLLKVNRGHIFLFSLFVFTYRWCKGVSKTPNLQTNCVIIIEHSTILIRRDNVCAYNYILSFVVDNRMILYGSYWVKLKNLCQRYHQWLLL